MAEKEKTILFIMPRLPFPAVSGRKTSLYHYCRILSEKMGYRLVVAAFLEGGDDPSDVPDFIDRLVVLPKIPAAEKIAYIMKESLILQRKPMQVCLYWSKNAKEIIDQLFDEEKPKYVIGDMVRSTEYIKDAPAFRIADLDDLISLRYERQLESDIDSINPYGAFLNTMPGVLQKILLFRPLKKWVLKHEIKLLREYEMEMGRVCEKTVFVAKKEAADFNRRLGMDKASAVPIGVDTDYYSYRKVGKSGDIIGFLGSMSVAHNDNAARHFILDILPLIVKKNPAVKFTVIGGGASDELMKLASQNVEFTGRVGDVREFLERCKVFVCPMTFGSGIKTKNLEAMAMGLPVVTTSIGAENIGAEPEKEWIVADDNKEFADAVLALLADEVKRDEIGYCASNFIRQNFTWDAAVCCFSELLGE